MDNERKRKLGEAYTKGTAALGESDSPENTILSGLRMIGGIEERGEGRGLGFRIQRKFTVLLAKSRL